MLTIPTLLIILAAAALYALLSRRIESSIFSMPMIFTGFGLALGRLGLNLFPLEVGHEVIHTIAEITLILVLFSDAAGVRRETLPGNVAIPARMLLIGMPLIIALGALAALLLFREEENQAGPLATGHPFLGTIQDPPGPLPPGPCLYGSGVTSRTGLGEGEGSQHFP